MASSSPTSPRWRVFRHLESLRTARVAADPPIWTEKVVDAQGNPATSPAPAAQDSLVVPIGDIGFASWHKPGLQNAQSYTATITQRIQYSGAGPEVPLVSTKTFKTPSTQWTLNPALVDSVYPPQGHGDSSNRLAYVLFNNTSVPWVNAAGVDHGNPSLPVPGMGLIVFEEEELSLTPTQAEVLGNLTTLKQPLSQNSNLAVNLSLEDLLRMNDEISHPILPVEESVAKNTAVQAIFMPSLLFDSIFATYKGTSVTPVSNAKPDLTRFVYMSHIRKVNTTGTASEEKSGNFSATLSPRVFKAHPNPKTIYAHLVSLPGIEENMVIPSGKKQKLAALVSMYSWSFTSLPLENSAVDDFLWKLGTQIQPLRNFDSLRSNHAATAVRSQTPADNWVKDRMFSGSTLIRYQARTGEATVAILRGLLSPIYPLNPDMPPSNYGTDLAILNKDMGMMDLTFQIAWELGRTLAMGDRTFSAALTRIRSQIHTKTLAQAKIDVDKASPAPRFVEKKDLLQKLSRTSLTLGRLDKPNSTVKLDFTKRWRRPDMKSRGRAEMAFSDPDVKKRYGEVLPGLVSNLAKADKPVVAGEIYNEMNTPVSPDFATILAWCMDKWFLQSIPFANLVPDPAFLPKESIRTFYVDPIWFKVFIDGALSIAQHFGDGDDYIRAEIKSNIDIYLQTNLENGHPPQIPMWGFFLRSQVVSQFQDLRISAPWDTANNSRAELLRVDRIQEDLLMILFDRLPDSPHFPEGIILQPPEHQLSFALGSPGDLDSDVPIHWKRVYADASVKQDYGPNAPQLPATTYRKSAPDIGVYDFSAQCICFPHFAIEAQKAMQPPSWPGNPVSNIPDPTPALAATQLIADIPILTIGKSSKNSLVQHEAHLPALSTSAKRLPHAAQRRPFPLRSTRVNLPRTNTTPRHEPSPSLVTVINAPNRVPIVHSGNTLDKLSANMLSWTNPNRGTAAQAFTLQGTVFFPNERTGPSESPAPNIGTHCWNWTKDFAATDGKSIYCLVPTIGAAHTRTDLHLPQGSCVTVKGWILKGIRMTFKVGGDGFLTPFIVGKNLTSLGSAQQPRGMDYDYGYKPQTAGVNLPTARFVGIGNRWLLATKFTDNDGAQPSGEGTFEIQLTPNSARDGLDIFDHRDLSVELQDVALNWKGTSADDVKILSFNVTEVYSAWPGSFAPTGDGVLEVVGRVDVQAAPSLLDQWPEKWDLD